MTIPPALLPPIGLFSRASDRQHLSLSTQMGEVKATIVLTSGSATRARLKMDSQCGKITAYIVSNSKPSAYSLMLIVCSTTDVSCQQTGLQSQGYNPVRRNDYLHTSRLHWTPQMQNWMGKGRVLRGAHDKRGQLFKRNGFCRQLEHLWLHRLQDMGRRRN
jgi:hypothetical protein